MYVVFLKKEKVIFDFCLRRGKFLEINAFPSRLDLPDTLVREAVKNGVKMVINTDAHCVDEMAMMPYGIAVARRGWATKEDVLNTYKYDRISQYLL